MKKVLFALASALVLTACYVNDKGEIAAGKRPEEPKADPGILTTEADSVIERYQTARVEEKLGHYDEAMKLYSLLLAEADNTTLYQSSYIGRARVLMKMGQFDAAMAALSPLPENPQSAFDCRKMVMAGRILETQGRTKEAESFYEVAVSGCPQRKDTAVFRAETLTALSRLYVIHGKTPRAVDALRAAGDLFESQGLREQAKQRRDQADYMANI